MGDKDKEEKDMATVEAKISKRLNNLAKRAEVRKNKFPKKELTPRMKEILNQNCDDLTYAQLETIVEEK